MITPQIVAAYPFLGKLSAPSRRLLEKHASVLSAMKGADLLRKGDRIRGLYLVVSGRLRVFTLNHDGDEAALYAIVPGESCPLAMDAMLHEKLHQAWVAADLPTKLLFIPAPIFRTLYEKESTVRDFALGVLAGRISTLMDSLAELSLDSIADRVKNHLLRAANERGEITATHQEIAHALGTAREVVSRQIVRLRRAGVVRTRRGRIDLLDARALA